MTQEELNDLNEEYTTITIKLDDDKDPYIAPHVYGQIDVSPKQSVRMLQVHTANELEIAIDTLKEVYEFKARFKYS